MSFLKTLHNLEFGWNPWLLWPTPLALATLILFLWSLAFLVRPTIPRGFVALLRITWVLALLPALTGILLALSGQKTVSATPASPEELARNCAGVASETALTRYCLPHDPSRNWEHWMYAFFVILSLIIIELILRGRVLEARKALRLLPVITLFLYGVVFMVGRVAIFPGSTPGT